MLNATLNTTIMGHVVIKDTHTGEVLVDKKNAIHPQNMATAIARGLANSPNHQIYKLKLGNGGTFINGTQQIEFQPARTVGETAELYNPTYVEVIDDEEGAAPGNSVVYSVIPGSTDSRVIITAVISADEAINNATDGGDGDASLNPEGEFFFDELGLFTKQTAGTMIDGTDELMLSHLIFSPIEHTGNREITIIYSLTISVS